MEWVRGGVEGVRGGGRCGVGEGRWEEWRWEEWSG